MTDKQRFPHCQPVDPLSSENTMDAESTTYQHALDSGELAHLRNTPINRLIQQAAVDVSERGVVDELGALRIVLTRLVNEQENLDLLTANVTRVAGVALQAARTQRLIGEGTTEMIAGALALIIDEIRKDRRAQALNPNPVPDLTERLSP
ncbi:MAG: hypothetical protein H0T93_09035 [Chloroflexia bacterium]|nr:hypothetical protein [Chloroflexia bacterium]